MVCLSVVSYAINFCLIASFYWPMLVAGIFMFNANLSIIPSLVALVVLILQGIYFYKIGSSSERINTILIVSALLSALITVIVTVITVSNLISTIEAGTASEFSVMILLIGNFQLFIYGLPILTLLVGALMRYFENRNTRMSDAISHNQKPYIQALITSLVLVGIIVGFIFIINLFAKKNNFRADHLKIDASSQDQTNTVSKPTRLVNEIDVLYGSTTLSIAPLDAWTYNSPDFKFTLPSNNRNIVSCDNYNPRYSLELNIRCWQALATLKKDSTYCGKIRDSAQRNNCYSDFGLIKKDISSCPPLDPPAYHNGSYACYFMFAMDNRDLSACNRFDSDTYNRALCYTSVALAEKDPTICALSSATSTDRDDCYSRLAYLSDFDLDVSAICSRISDEKLKDKCLRENDFTRIAKTGMVDECQKFPSNEKNLCIIKAAAIRSNPALCEHIGGDSLDMTQCIDLSDSAMKDSSACGLVKADKTYQPDNRDTCYFDFATKNQKPDDCKNISSALLADRCKWMTSPDIYRTYTNLKHGYSLKYNWNTKVAEVDSGTDPSSCVSVEKGVEYILIKTGGGQSPCAGTGVGLGDKLESEDVYVMGEKYTATGFVSPNRDYGQLSFNVGNIYISFGVDTNDSIDSLTDYWYRSSLDSIKEILSTLNISQSPNLAGVSQAATTTVYRSEKYGFEFSYPSYFHFQDDSGSFASTDISLALIVPRSGQNLQINILKNYGWPSYATSTARILKEVQMDESSTDIKSYNYDQEVQITASRYTYRPPVYDLNGKIIQNESAFHFILISSKNDAVLLEIFGDVTDADKATIDLIVKSFRFIK